MAILDFIKRASVSDIKRMLLLTLVAGLANALLVVIVSDVAKMVAQGSYPMFAEWVIFAAAFVIYHQSNRIALMRANVIIEQLLADLRVRLTDKLRMTELPVAERLGRSHFYGLISREANQLSVTFPLIVDGFQQSILLFVSLIYLAYLSPMALAVFLLAVGVGIIGYRHINHEYRDIEQLAFVRQAEMLDATGDIIKGFKEIRLNTVRSAAAMAEYQSVSDLAEASSISSGERWASLILLSSVVTYLMLGMICFVLPQYMTQHGVTVFELVPVLLFCMGPVARLVAQSPMFLEAEAGLKAIGAVERQLDAGGTVSPAEARAMATAYLDFHELAYRDLTFSYVDQCNGSTFRVGPLNLTVKRGETLFLVGGNGSGKSTTLRLLTGLYPAQEGVIEVDHMRVEGRAVGGLRELFSAVFADFHLFDRLYGVENIDPAAVQRLIAEMGLAHKVRFEGGRFSQINLSTGQRKRLALIAALAENRPIYVFDEWSAEQDVHFRNYFYTHVLANLKAAGKTVIAVTHDERYWHVADRVVRLDLGKVQWERSGAQWRAA